MAQRSLSELLERVSVLLTSELRASATRHDLKLVQLQALHYLARCNRYSDSPAALTEFLAVTKGTTSQSLMALERKGLIRKEPDAVDGRVVHCSLTPAGKAVVRKTLARPFDDGKPPPGLHDALLDLLARAQRKRGGRSFSVCATCRYFQNVEQGFRCGLTSEPLTRLDSTRICREHLAA